tara:strand:+ start:617 stop:1168 length:552 start_codon:yes stop_codon:yes gene_type:complete
MPKNKGLDPKKFIGGIQHEVNQMARQAALEVINELARLGPAYSGEFRGSWVAVPLGGGRAGGKGRFPYRISHIPKLNNHPRELKRAIKFSIQNTQPYADYALDLKMGRFFKPLGYPIKQPVKVGTRAAGLTYRGEVQSGGGQSVSTAELDWYSNYVYGGALQKSVEKGVKQWWQPSSNLASSL